MTLKLVFKGQELKEKQKEVLRDLLQAEIEQSQEPFQINFDFPWQNCNVNSRKKFSEMICQNTPENKDLSKVLELLQSGSKSNRKQPIAIVGQGRIGKTQLLKTLLKTVQNENRANLYDYIFYVSLKDIVCCEEMNILQLLTANKSELHWIDCQGKSGNQLLKRIIGKIFDANQTKVCIIFDDFEKLDFLNAGYSSNKNVFHNHKAGYLVANTIKTWFGGCQKILLLHPWSYLQLKKTLSPAQIHMVYVQGISLKPQKRTEQNKAYRTINECQQSEEKADFVLKTHADKLCQCCHLGNCYQEIQSLCFAPNNWNLLKQQLSSVQHFSVVKIAVNLLTPSLKAIPHIYMQDSESSSYTLEKTLSFAWKHYVQNKFLFNDSELHQVLDANDINYLFDCRRKKIGFGEDLVFFFSHVLLQELLATMWLLSISTEQLEAELSDCKKSPSKETKAVLGKFLSETRELALDDNGRMVPPLTVNEETFERLTTYFGTLMYLNSRLKLFKAFVKQ